MAPVLVDSPVLVVLVRLVKVITVAQVLTAEVSLLVAVVVKAQLAVMLQTPAQVVQAEREPHGHLRALLMLAGVEAVLTPDQVARVVLVAVAPAQPQRLLLRPEQ